MSNKIEKNFSAEKASKEGIKKSDDHFMKLNCRNGIIDNNEIIRNLKDRIGNEGKMYANAFQLALDDVERSKFT